MLKYSTYSDAVIAPYEVDEKGVRRIGLIVDDEVIEESLVRRGKTIVTGVENTSLVRSIAQPGPYDHVIYAGLASSNFGHFLLESLSRLWIRRLMPSVPLVWMGPTSFTSWQAEILDIIGITGPHVFVQFPQSFKSVVLPDVGYRIHDFFSREHRNYLGVVSPSSPVKGRKAWISRSRLSRAGRVVGEKEIEEELMRNGWEIFHPQEHKVLEQLKYLSSCEDIAGWEGSAFHSLILLKKLKTAIHLFKRGQRLNDNYWTIADAKGFVQTVHALPLSHIGGKSSKARWELDDATRVIDILRRLDRRSSIVSSIGRMEALIPGSMRRSMRQRTIGSESP